jgi:hypothetical protein
MYTRHLRSDPNYISIGNRRLIQQRDDSQIPGSGRGKLGEYIPFYFAGHSPMLYNLKTGYGETECQPQHELVYIVSQLPVVTTHCQKWLFTDGHARDRLTTFYDDLSQLDCIDWETVQTQYWRNTEADPDRQRRKQAEFLVRNYLPVACVECLIVATQERKTELLQMDTNVSKSISIYIDRHHRYFYP